MSLTASLDQQFVWHPYTQHFIEHPPLAVKSAEGSRIILEDGRSIIDAVSSWWVNLHGHCHPYISKKLGEQLESLHQVIFAGFTHFPAAELARRLSAILPGEEDKRIFYSDDGSTAVEAALKIAVQYWANRGERRSRIIAFSGGYHGDTFGSMSLAARGEFFRPFEELLFEVSYLPQPDSCDAERCLQLLESELERGEVAAFIFEPLVQAAGGMRFYSEELLSRLIALCRRKEVLTIADEVFTGFGRTGRMFASQYLSETPDIFCLSKGLTGGTLPLGVTTCRQDIYRRFLSDDRSKMLTHGHSYTANPLSCAAALASLDLLERPSSWDSIKKICDMQSQFAAGIAGHPKARNARALGTIAAFDVTSGAASSSYLSPLRERLYDFAIGRSILLRPLGNVVYCVPPYCISDEDLASVHACMQDVLDEI